MIPKTLTALILPSVAVVALMIHPTDAFAQRGGGGRAGGGFRGGGFNGVHYGAVGGVRNGYRPYSSSYGYRPYSSNFGYRPFNGYRTRPFYGFGFYPYLGGYGYTPYYQNYWAYPSIGYDLGTYLNAGSIPAVDSSSGVVIASGEQGASPASSMDNSTHITVRLPANADLWFEGTKMSASGSVRTFTVPSAMPGGQYNYTIRARWNDNDNTIDQTQKVTFTAGTDLQVTFPVPSGTGGEAK